MIKRLSFVLLSIALAAACGGKSKGPAGAATPDPAGGASADDPATPFDDGKLKAALASTAGVSSCSVEPSTTMGAHLAAQRTALETGGDGTAVVDEAFSCNDLGEGAWECQWSVFTRPEAPDPDDPCAEGGGSGYIIIVNVGGDGAIVPDKIYCNAPG